MKNPRGGKGDYRTVKDANNNTVVIRKGSSYDDLAKRTEMRLRTPNEGVIGRSANKAVGATAAAIDAEVNAEMRKGGHPQLRDRGSKTARPGKPSVFGGKKK